MNSYFKCLVLFSVITLQVQAQSTKSFFKTSDQFLKKYVRDGKVNYQTIINNNLIDLNTTIAIGEQALKANQSVTNYEELWDANTHQAFWINMYNLLVIRGISDYLKDEQINSPKDIEGFFDKKLHSLGHLKLTLNDIENNFLRNQYKDPRIHFAIVCAGLSCPPIIPEAYKPKTINQQLNKQVVNSLNDNDFIRVDHKNKHILISEIFTWYKEDFLLNQKSILAFINLYRKEKIPSNYTIGNYDYNWELNAM